MGGRGEAREKILATKQSPTHSSNISEIENHSSSRSFFSVTTTLLAYMFQKKITYSITIISGFHSSLNMYDRLADFNRRSKTSGPTVPVIYHFDSYMKLRRPRHQEPW